MVAVQTALAYVQEIVTVLVNLVAGLAVVQAAQPIALLDAEAVALVALEEIGVRLVIQVVHVVTVAE